jgi:hypothetical protein
LHLGKLPDHLKPNIPVEYKKAITDYLKEMRKVNILYIYICVIVKIFLVSDMFNGF